MKPQHTKPGLVNQPSEIVAPFGVSYFMEQNRVDFWFAQQAIDSIGQRNPGAQNSRGLRTLVVAAELYRDALRHESGALFPGKAALGANPAVKSHRHERRAREPYHAEERGRRSVLKNVVHFSADET